VAFWTGWTKSADPVNVLAWNGGASLGIVQFVDQ